MNYAKFHARKADAIKTAKRMRHADPAPWGVVTRPDGQYRVRKLTSKTNKRNIVFKAA